MASKPLQRPFALDPLFRTTRGLPGIGDKNGIYLSRLIDGETLKDMLFHKPIDIIDRSYKPKIAEAQHGKVATLRVNVDKHSPSPRRGLPYRITASDETGEITLVFFNAHPDYLKKHLPMGEDVLISGTLDRYQGKLQMTHPDYILPPSEEDQMPKIEPIYPMTQGLSPKTFRKAMLAALDQCPDLPEWHDPTIIKRHQWRTWKEAILNLHKPDNASDLSEHSKDRERLAYDELLSSQLTLAIVRNMTKTKAGRVLQGNNSLKRKILTVLPYQLTGAQERALEEIYEDMQSPHKMLRLLQGDVGAGKTIVALLAMAQAVEAGTQAAIMAPTEILARQHAESLEEICHAAGIKTITLTGRDKGKKRDAILEQIADGSAQIIIGTHALFQETVVFKDLGLAVIDEQHRFGVHQRMMLSGKNKDTDTLVMTATPIPRTLTMTVFGDMDTSRLDAKPAGR